MTSTSVKAAWYLSGEQGILMLREDLIDVQNLATNKVFQFLKAVEPTPALSDLCQPGPDVIRGGVNGDGMSGNPVRIEKELITRPGNATSSSVAPQVVR